MLGSCSEMEIGGEKLAHGGRVIFGLHTPHACGCSRLCSRVALLAGFAPTTSRPSLRAWLCWGSDSISQRSTVRVVIHPEPLLTAPSTSHLLKAHHDSSRASTIHSFTSYGHCGRRTSQSPFLAQAVFTSPPSLGVVQVCRSQTRHVVVAVLLSRGSPSTASTPQVQPHRLGSRPR